MKPVMKAQTKIVLFLSLALLPLGTCAQEPETQAPADQPISPPPTLNGQRPSLAFQSEKTPSNYLSGGLNFIDAFTDNMYMSSADTMSSFSYLVQPYISYAQSTPRINWDASFGAGFLFYQHLSGEDQIAKSVGLDLTYRLSQRVKLRLTDTFTDTTGLFSSFNPGTSGSNIGLVEQSNNSLLVPALQRTVANASLAELSYQFSPSSVVGVRGTFSILDFPGSSPNTEFGPLYNTQTYSGEAFYNHKMSLRQWLGVSLRAQRFQTQPSAARTDTASLLLYYAVQVRSDVTISFFAGPEYYNTPSISEMATANGLFQGHQWAPAVGATFNWQGENTSVAAGFSRQLSDGGGLFSAVTLQQVNASLRCQLTERQAVQIGFMQAVNEPLASGNSYSGLSGLFEFEHLLTKNLILRLAYGRQRQELPPSQNTASANNAWLSLSYNFSHAFGR